MKITNATAIPVTNLPLADAAGGADFSDKLMDSIQAISDAQSHADGVTADVASGGDADIHDMMIALEEADIALRAMVSVRDRLVDGFKEVMNMQV